MSLVVTAAICTALAASCSRRAPDAPPPNVVVLVVDTLRADRLHCYGASRETSPTLDRIAAEGVLFEQAFTVAPSTWQSFVSILTGLNPPRHGVRFIFDRPLATSIPSLGSVLGDSRYTTAAFDVIGFVRGMTGGHGFQSYIDSASVRKAELSDAELTDQLLRWLAAQPDQPFFVFVRYLGPHWPYRPRQEFHLLFGSDENADHSFNEGNYGVSLVPNEQGVPELRMTDPEAHRRLVYGELAPPTREHMILHYDAAVRTVDEQIGRVVDALRQAALLESTLLVVTSDHGESFGERGYLQHGPRVDEAVMQVPLIIRFPSRAPHGRPSQRIAQLVRTIDIAPTVLATIHVPIPDGVQGTSLLPAIDGGVDLALTAYGESAGAFVEVDAQTVMPGVPGRHRMLRTARWKLVLVPDGQGGRYHLHDMANRGEDEEVAGAHPWVLADMRADLEAILAADSGSADASQTPLPLTDAQRERLRALGYL